MTPEINLKPRRDIKTRELPYASHSERHEAWDAISQDNDPESRWNIVGRGNTRQAAIRDLLEKLAEAEASPPVDHFRVGRTQESPGELVPEPYVDPDDDSGVMFEKDER